MTRSLSGYFILSRDFISVSYSFVICYIYYLFICSSKISHYPSYFCFCDPTHLFHPVFSRWSLDDHRTDLETNRETSSVETPPRTHFPSSVGVYLDVRISRSVSLVGLFYGSLNVPPSRRHLPRLDRPHTQVLLLHFSILPSVGPPESPCDLFLKQKLTLPKPFGIPVPRSSVMLD